MLPAPAMATATLPEQPEDPLDGLLDRLPVPTTRLSAELQEDVISALRNRDADALRELLDETPIMRSEVALHGVWLPLSDGLQTLAMAGRPLPESESLVRLLRTQTRQALLTLPGLPVSAWRLPANIVDATTARLAFLTNALRKLGAKVWPMKQQAAETAPTEVGDEPAVDEAEGSGDEDDEYEPDDDRPVDGNRP